MGSSISAKRKPKSTTQPQEKLPPRKVELQTIYHQLFSATRDYLTNTNARPNPNPSEEDFRILIKIFIERYRAIENSNLGAIACLQVTNTEEIIQEEIKKLLALLVNFIHHQQLLADMKKFIETQQSNLAEIFTFLESKRIPTPQYQKKIELIFNAIALDDGTIKKLKARASTICYENEPAECAKNSEFLNILETIGENHEQLSTYYQGFKKNKAEIKKLCQALPRSSNTLDQTTHQRTQTQFTEIKYSISNNQHPNYSHFIYAIAALTVKGGFFAIKTKWALCGWGSTPDYKKFEKYKAKAKQEEVMTQLNKRFDKLTKKKNEQGWLSTQECQMEWCYLALLNYLDPKTEDEKIANQREKEKFGRLIENIDEAIFSLKPNTKIETHHMGCFSGFWNLFKPKPKPSPLEVLRTRVGNAQQHLDKNDEITFPVN